MKSLHIRNVDERVLARLRSLAKAHHRSVQAEVRAILEEAAHYAPDDASLAPLNLATVQTGRADSWSRIEIYDDDAR
jgi:plasmid stability protein